MFKCLCFIIIFTNSMSYFYVIRFYSLHLNF